MTNASWLSTVAVAACVAVTGIAPAGAQTADLTKLSLEDLLNTEITSVSGKEQMLSRTAAAVYVITQEDIRRSGAKTIPDLLRMAPGLSVGQIDTSSWAISARGFNGLYANKLLVLIDGRSVYSPMLGGVYWDMQNVPLQDIERIEVIRGPGGTLWGANAMNGVINIITKPAHATQGGAFTARAGNMDQRFGELQYGGRLAGRGHYRVYGRFAERATDGRAEGDPDLRLEEFPDPDAATVGLGGVRLDWRNELNKVSVHGLVQKGDGRHVRSRPTLSAPWVIAENKPVSFTDGNVVLSWKRSHSSRSQTNVQTYYQDYRRLENGISHDWHIADIDVRRQQALGRRHEFVAGLGYRFASSAVANSQRLAYLPAQETMQLFTGFIHDEMEITNDIRLTLGTKVEHNSYTAVELQPTLRATWTPSREQVLWTAITRAVRTPARIDRGLRVLSTIIPGSGGLPLLIAVEGSPDYQSEDVEAVETGYRWNRGAVSVDVTAFWNGYDRLRGTEPGGTRLGLYEDRPVLLLVQRFANLLNATAQGAELAATWQPIGWWKISGSYAWLQLTAEARDGSSAVPALEGPVPDQQFHLRTYLDLPGNLEASALLFGASANVPLAVERYKKLDLSLRWRASRAIELSAAVQNLLHDDAGEFTDIAAPLTVPVRTTVLGEISWRF